jgi:hypothetical protein
MSWICPIRTDRNCGRNRGALPRLRGRGERRSIVTYGIQLSKLCIVPTEVLQRCLILRARRPRDLAPSSRSADNRAQDGARRYIVMSLRSPRPRKRGSAPRLRLESAFSLVEVLASLFILTLSAAGITAAWRLADYQELLTRVDRRAERILRQYYELQTFAPPDSRPFTVNATPAPSPVTGYLYYPRLIANQSGSTAVGKLIPFSLSLTNGTASGTSQLVLTYTVPSFGTQASRQVTRTVVLNP